MQKRVLIALPVVAIVFVVLWRSLASPPVIAQENKRTRIDAPPGVECEALLQSSLEAIQQGLETTEALAPRLAGARVTLSVGTGTDSPDKEWQDTERRSSFVDAFVDAPPGVSISAQAAGSDSGSGFYRARAAGDGVAVAGAGVGGGAGAAGSRGWLARGVIAARDGGWRRLGRCGERCVYG